MKKIGKFILKDEMILFWIIAIIILWKSFAYEDVYITPRYSEKKMKKI